MLAARYDNDGIQPLELNALQIATRDVVRQRMDQGVYPQEQIPCPLCEGGRFRVLAKKDRYGLPHSIVICTQCGLVLANPRMTKAAYEDFYQTLYRPLYVGRPQADAEFFNDQFQLGQIQRRFLMSSGLLPDLAGKVVWEVGCGAGGILQAFRAAGAQVFGVDYGEEYVRYGAQQHGLALQAGPLATLRNAPAPDLVIYSHVLEHVLDPVAELQLLSQLTGPQTLIFIEVPGLRWTHRAYGQDFALSLQNAHVFHFSLSTLKQLFARFGFACLGGHEYIRAIFRKGGEPQPASAVASDYGDTMAYLERLESLYHLKQLYEAELSRFDALAQATFPVPRTGA